ncbi:hypothetical protein [Burkholderia vietnamiensis]|uniref:hypothetical protein n=1 Tax=Burkholderia vietnamiensis TaxID=60552 RepID=UPI001CF3E6CB|nr:hypothetical protein [Burkholderia vietnamiensis]MCA8228225.1 hypothetical protein [Burkholderia vietnamiensis]
MITHNQAKSAATRIVDRLRALGVDIKNSHGYQAVAAYNDYPDWNRLNAAISNAAAPSATDSPGTTPPAPSKLPVDHNRYHILFDAPGSGKTTALWMRALVEAREFKGTFLFINIDGEDHVPSALSDTTHRITISASSDSQSDQRPVTSVAKAKSAHPSGAFVSIRLPEGTSVLSEAARGHFLYALRLLPETLRELMPVAFLESVSLICLDEAHRVARDPEQELFATVVPRWRLGNAHIVIATQWIEPALHAITRSGATPTFVAFSKRTVELYGRAFSGHNLPEPSIVEDFLLPKANGDATELFTLRTSLVEQIAGVVYSAFHKPDLKNWADSPRMRLYRTLIDEAATRDAERRRRSEAKDAATIRPYGARAINKGFALEP